MIDHFIKSQKTIVWWYCFR